MAGGKWRRGRGVNEVGASRRLPQAPSFSRVPCPFLLPLCPSASCLLPRPLPTPCSVVSVVLHVTPCPSPPHPPFCTSRLRPPRSLSVPLPLSYPPALHSSTPSVLRVLSKPHRGSQGRQVTTRRPAHLLGPGRNVPEHDLPPEAGACHPLPLLRSCQAGHVVTMLHEGCQQGSARRGSAPQVDGSITRTANQGVADEREVVYPVDMTFEGGVKPARRGEWQVKNKAQREREGVKGGTWVGLSRDPIALWSSLGLR